MTWSKLKVAELQSELRKRGLSYNGRKAELVARLEESDKLQEAPLALEENLATEDARDLSGPIEAIPEENDLPRKRNLDDDDGSMDPAVAKKKQKTDDVSCSPATNTMPNLDIQRKSIYADETGYDEDDEPLYSGQKRGKEVRGGAECPYLDTVRRQNLDFDFEKCCSISLSQVNVYVCLVCGKYFQGRGPSTHAYTHSLESGHHLFMKLDSGRTFCLPDLYEVSDPSLADIQYVLNPIFTSETVRKLDTTSTWAKSLDGREYMPGLIGLNNMKANDYANVILQALIRISPLRDFFLRRENYAHHSTPLLERFGELVRKTWNSRAFKGHVSPHDFMQSVMTRSEKKFIIDKQADPVHFFSWLLNALHLDLTKGDRKKPSVITNCLEGEIELTTLAGTGSAKKSSVDVVQRVPFLLLTLDLPPSPLFKDALEKIVIPQIPIFDLLKKFDGKTVQDDVRTGQRKMRITRLPKYLAIHVKRFLKNQFFFEKNPTIVNFPVKGLDLRQCIPVPSPNAKYDLIGNIVHEGDANIGTFKAHIHRQSEGIWYEVQDLHLSDVLPQQVVLSEAYLQIYQRIDE